jgi:hypothetical protein
MAQPNYKSNLKRFCLRNNLDIEKVTHHVGKSHTWYIDVPTENVVILCGRKTTSNRSTSVKIGSLSKLLTFGEQEFIILKTTNSKCVVVCWQSFLMNKSTPTFSGEKMLSKMEDASQFAGKLNTNIIHAQKVFISKFVAASTTTPK